MRMPDALSTSDADFSHMAADVYIGRVLHQTSVAVDRPGTVACEHLPPLDTDYRSDPNTDKRRELPFRSSLRLTY